MSSGSGTWPRRVLVEFRITSDKTSRRWFGRKDKAEQFAAAVRETGGHAEVLTQRDLVARRHNGGHQCTA